MTLLAANTANSRHAEALTKVRLNRWGAVLNRHDDMAKQGFYRVARFYLLRAKTIRTKNQLFQRLPG